MVRHITSTVASSTLSRCCNQVSSYSIIPSSQPGPSSSSTAAKSSASGNGTVSLANTSSSLGLHDAVRYGPRSLNAELAPKHPLESRLTEWDATQRDAKLTLQRNIYGLAMPLRQLMERDVVLQGTPPSLPGQPRLSNLHMDILTGQDEALEVSDAFLPDRDVPVGVAEGDFHATMERRLRI